MRTLSPKAVAVFATLTSCLLVGLLGAAWLKTGSVAVLSVMADSVLDIVISGSTVAVIHYAGRPADNDHRFGHGKAEGVAALFQAAFICGSGIFIALEALSRFNNPTPVTGHYFAIGVLLVVSLITAGLVYLQKQSALTSGSLAVDSDRNHYVGDIAVNLGVVLTLLLDKFAGVAWMDPLVAIGIMLWLCLMALKISRQALDMLLDREVTGQERDRLVECIKGVAGVLGMHDLRFTKSGMRPMVVVDIETDGSQSLNQAHDIAHGVESAILALNPNAHIVIHLDPAGHTHDSRHI